MNKKILFYFYIVSLTFLIFIIVFVGYRVKTRLDKNLIATKERMEEIKVSALSTYLAGGDFDSEYFKHKMKSDFQNADRLLLLSIYSREEGILYLLTKNRNYLISPLSKGEPEYEFKTIFETKHSSAFAPGVQRDLFIDGLFTQLGKADLYPILKEALYIILSYVLITSIILLLVSTSYETKPVDSENRYQPSKLEPIQKQQNQTITAVHENNSLFSPETGLGWEKHLEQRLGFELERAASFDQDLVLILISLDNASTLHKARDVYRELAKLIPGSFPFRDLAFEYERYGYAVILPDKNLDQALKDTQRFKKQLESSNLAGQPITVSIGLSSRSGRLINEKRLLIETEKAFQRAIRSGGKQIIAFRADPAKFRKLISSTKSHR